MSSVDFRLERTGKGKYRCDNIFFTDEQVDVTYIPTRPVRKNVSRAEPPRVTYRALQIFDEIIDDRMANAIC